MASGSRRSGKYILFVSGGRPEKNLGRALLAFRDFCKEKEKDKESDLRSIRLRKIRKAGLDIILLKMIVYLSYADTFQEKSEAGAKAFRGYKGYL